MIHFDAHSDTNDRYFGDNKYTHGTPFRRAVEEGLLDPRRTVQIGIRGSIYSADDMEFAEQAGMRVIYMEEFTKLGVEQDDRGGAPRRRRRPDLCQLRRRRPRSRLRAGHRHAGDRRPDDAGGAAHPARTAGARPHRRRRGRSLAALRSQRQHGAGRRHHHVRDHVPAGRRGRKRSARGEVTLTNTSSRARPRLDTIFCCVARSPCQTSPAESHSIPKLGCEQRRRGHARLAPNLSHTLKRRRIWLSFAAILW